MADVPFLKNRETEPFRNLPYTDICETNTNSSLEYKQGYGSNVSQSRQPANGGEQIGLDMTGLLTEQDIQWQLAKIKEQIDYDTLLEGNPADGRLVDEIVSIILDVMVSPGPFVRIDREERPRALVRHQLGLLDSEAVELVIGQYKAVTEPIKRKRQYLLTALYNARMEFDAHYTNLVNHDRNGGGKCG